MELEEKFKYYNRYDLKGFTYVLFLNGKPQDELISLSKKISNLGGVS
jgi:hypothetical protein